MFEIKSNARDATYPLPVKGGGVEDVGPGATVTADIDPDHPSVVGLVAAGAITINETGAVAPPEKKG